MFTSQQKVKMRAKEFLTEQELADVHDGLDVASLALPYTYMMPELNNSNFYDIYRFGVAIAAVRGEAGDIDGVQDQNRPDFRATSEWGQHLIVSSYDPEIKTVLKKALSKTDHSGMKSVSSPGSEEMKDTYIGSPVKAFKGYPK
jgi:hypothetical protein